MKVKYYIYLIFFSNIYSSLYVDSIKAATTGLENIYMYQELDDCSKCGEYIIATKSIFRYLDLYLEKEKESNLAFLYKYYYLLSRTIGAVSTGYYYENSNKNLSRDKLIPQVVSLLDKENDSLYKKIQMQECKILGFSDSMALVYYKSVISYQRESLGLEERERYKKTLHVLFNKKMYSYEILKVHYLKQLDVKNYDRILNNIDILNSVIEKVKYGEYVLDDLIRYTATALQSQRKEKEKLKYLRSINRLLKNLHDIKISDDDKNRYMCMLFEPAFLINLEYKSYCLKFYKRNKEAGFGFLRDMLNDKDRYTNFFNFIKKQIDLDKLKSDTTKSVEK